MKPITNRQARAKYEFLDSWDAGLVLSGAEAKAVKAGRMNLTGSYVTIDEKGEVWLQNAHISPWQALNQPNYNPDRQRKLLLERREINTMIGKLNTAGLTIIPERVYSKSGLVKVKLSLARGLKRHDKREKLKKRDTDRKIRRAAKMAR